MNVSEADEEFPQAQVPKCPELGTEGLHNDPCLGVFWLELDYTPRQYKKELRGEF